MLKRIIITMAMASLILSGCSKYRIEIHNQSPDALTVQFANNRYYIPSQKSIEIANTETGFYECSVMGEHTDSSIGINLQWWKQESLHIQKATNIIIRGQYLIEWDR